VSGSRRRFLKVAAASIGAPLGSGARVRADSQAAVQASPPALRPAGAGEAVLTFGGDLFLTATLADNFCNGWSGGLNFLQYRHRGSEVSVEPGGNVYPCCMKTVLPIGNLLEEKLEAILDRLIGNPVYEAISMGHPERMGISHGWSVERFLERSKVTLASGRTYQNLCVGCDAFHREVLGRERAGSGRA